MNNAPFKIGEPVVCVSVPDYIWTRLVKGETYRVLSLECCPACKKWYVGYTVIDGDESDNDCACGFEMPMSPFRIAYATRFAPIQENYADATAEILEKFSPTPERGDRVQEKQKIEI